MDSEPAVASHRDPLSAVATTPDTTGGAPSQAGSAVTIRAIETIPIRAPLARAFQGSYYRMTHRATLVVRCSPTRAWSARRTSATRTRAPARSTAVAARRDRPARDRPRRAGDRAVLGRRPTRRRSTSCATAASAWWRWPHWTPRSGTRSARRSASRCGGCGAAARDRVPMTAIGGYYGEPARSDRGGGRRLPRRCSDWPG